jgi:hypothetical protein
MAAQAMRAGMSIEEIHEASKFDPWFLREVEKVVLAENEVRAKGLPKGATALRGLKALGFSDKRLATLAGVKEAEVAALRGKLGVQPVYKRIDTCAAEFASDTPYMYSTYEGGFGTPVCESRPTARRKVVILGGGPNRIGQGIEFDYCCVHACYALRDAGYETIMVNCNPETVSTDYDTSDRLYFEPLTAEDVIALIRKEQESGEVLGCIVQYGGQTPLKLSQALHKAGIPILGTSAEAIDIAEDRERFQHAAEGPRPEAAAERHRAHARGSGHRGQPHRLPGGGAPLLRARRAGDGDRLQRRTAPPLRRGGREGLWREPDPDRPVPAGRDRGGRGLHLRRRRPGLCRGRDGAHRGSRHPFRRFRLLAAALFAAARDRHGTQGRDRGDGPRAEGAGA